MLVLVDLLLVGDDSQLAIRPLVGWMSGSWTHNWARFGWRPLRHSLGSVRLKASKTGCRRAVPLLIYLLEFALHVRKHGKPQSE